MRKDKIVALVGALIIAITFGFGLEYFSNYINLPKQNNQNNYQKDEKNINTKNNESNNIQKNIETNFVLVSKINITKGETLFSKSVKWVEWPIKTISKDFISKDKSGKYMHPSLTLESILGLIANTNIIEGTPISVSMFVKKGNFSNKSLFLRKGMRAISVPVDKNSIKHHAFNPGDIVEVYLPNKTKCISNVRILAFDNKTEMLKYEKELSNKHSFGANIPDTVTLELTPEQSDIMVQNLKGGGVYLVLMSHEDTDENSAPFEKPIFTNKNQNNEEEYITRKSEIENIKRNMHNDTVSNSNEEKDKEDNSMILVIKRDKAGFVNPHDNKNKFGD